MKVGSNFWAGHVAAVKRESITASAYAKQHNISVSALYYWQRKLTQAEPADVSVGVGKFVALQIASGPMRARSESIILILSSGLRMEMAALPSPEWLAALERATQGAR